jgi:hypothetical protein
MIAFGKIREQAYADGQGEKSPHGQRGIDFFMIKQIDIPD